MSVVTCLTLWVPPFFGWRSYVPFIIRGLQHSTPLIAFHAFQRREHTQAPEFRPSPLVVFLHRSCSVTRVPDFQSGLKDVPIDACLIPRFTGRSGCSPEWFPVKLQSGSLLQAPFSASSGLPHGLSPFGWLPAPSLPWLEQLFGEIHREFLIFSAIRSDIAVEYTSLFPWVI